MSELHGSGAVKIGKDYYPYILTNIFHKMESVSKSESYHKPFRSKKSKLCGKNVYHVHHSTNHEIAKNLIRYMRKHYEPDDIIVDELSKLRAKYPKRNDHMSMFVQETLMKSFEWSEKTGEWLVFQKQGGEIHFVCLYLHNYDDANDQQFYSFIENELRWNST